MSSPSAPSIVRTIAPVAVGQLVAYLVSLGIVIPEDVEAALTVILGFVVTSVYYLIVRFLEQKFPKLGALLGWAATPGVYAKHHAVSGPETLEADTGLENGPAH